MPKLLVVEDDAANRDLIARLLAGLGYKVATAEHGLRGLALARELQPDVILLDMGLPLLNGWQVAQRLKAQPATRAIPIIALTAYALIEDRERCLAAGCDEYDSKPIEVERLHAKIQLLLQRAAGGAPA